MPERWQKPRGETIECSTRLAVVWTVKRYRLVQVNGRSVFDIGTPEHVRWYTEGRLATRTEVLASIDSGLPALYESANPRGQVGADEILLQYEACMPLLPAG